MARTTSRRRAKAKATSAPAEPTIRPAPGGLLERFEISPLLELMTRHGLTEIDIREGDRAITLRKAGPPAHGAVMAAPAPQAPPPFVMPMPAMSQAAPTESAAPAEELLAIKSPMVGTFYTAPDPESPPYVTVGSRVGPDSVVCIVEAMKVMNEIKAECAGTIVECRVQNGQAVEFGQPLFSVRPE